MYLGLCKELVLYVNYKQDESYTPNKLSVRAGTNLHDLQEIDVIELMEPEGWLSIPLCSADRRLAWQGLLPLCMKSLFTAST